MAEPPVNSAADTSAVQSLRQLLESDLATPATRAALQARLQPASSGDGTAEPVFFDPRSFATLVAVCARLLPPAASPTPADCAREIDARLSEGKGNGWRFDQLPPDAAAYRIGLRGLDESARLVGAENFRSLPAARQDEILGALARGEAAGSTWAELDGRRFFEELLAELSEWYVSHPLTQQSIGYAGFADAAGWHKIGLNEREAWEPADGQRQFSLPAILPARARQRELGQTPARRFPEQESVDAVVIGTGAGGGPLLARLAQAGLRVVALEAGKFWNPRA